MQMFSGRLQAVIYVASIMYSTSPSNTLLLKNKNISLLFENAKTITLIVLFYISKMFLIIITEWAISFFRGLEK